MHFYNHSEVITLALTSIKHCKHQSNWDIIKNQLVYLYNITPSSHYHHPSKCNINLQTRSQKALLAWSSLPTTHLWPHTPIYHTSISINRIELKLLKSWLIKQKANNVITLLSCNARDSFHACLSSEWVSINITQGKKDEKRISWKLKELKAKKQTASKTFSHSFKRMCRQRTKWWLLSEWMNEWQYKGIYVESYVTEIICRLENKQN